jgi:anthranilate synthase component 1
MLKLNEVSSYNRFKARAKEKYLVPISKTLLADAETPVSVFGKIRKHTENPFLLESVEGGEKLARYSFIGLKKSATFSAFMDEWDLSVSDASWQAWFKTEKKQSTISALKALLKKVSIQAEPDMPRLVAGAVGYIGYDAIRLVEDLPRRPKDDMSLADIHLGFYTSVIIFDNLSHTITITVSPYISDQGNIEHYYREAVEHIATIETYIKDPNTLPITVSNESSDEWQSNISQETYEKWVQKSRDYIAAGDIFQVVLSQRFQCRYKQDPFDIYRILRIVNPSPYLYFLDKGEAQIIGSSPEMLVRLENGIVETCPIAGTRPRGKDELEDQRLEQNLIKDEKERAEHIMLVDLGRNDIGKISQAGTVEVYELMKIERYSHVMHIVSNVRGKLHQDMDVVDAFFSCFPAGTVSGAPKIRAMEIIDEMEPVKRGIYAGAVGYFDFSGNMDWCIAIRTIVVNNGNAYIQAGAGLVHDSIPEKEFEETCNKAAGMKLAVTYK